MNGLLLSCSSKHAVSLSLTCPSHLCCVLCCSLQVKLMKYICKQLQCKQKVPETERPEALDSYPHLRDWLRTINLRPELIEVGHVVSPSVCGLGDCLCHIYADSACVLSVCSHAHEEYLTGDPSTRRLLQPDMTII